MNVIRPSSTSDTQRARKSWWIAVLLVLIGAISYGCLSVLIKYAYQDFTIAQVTTAQIMIGVATLWLIVLARPSSRVNPFRGPWLKLALIGVFGLFGTTYLFNTALTYLDASFTMVLLFQFTWITVLMDSLARKVWPSLFQILGIVVILAGTTLAVDIWSADFAQMSMVGIALGLISAITYASFLFFAGRVEHEFDPYMRAAVMWTPAVPLVFIIWPPNSALFVDADSLLLWALLLGLLGQVIPTITFNFGIPRIGSSLAAMIGSMELPAAIILAYILLSERFGTLQWVGVLMILGGIVVSEWRMQKGLRVKK